MFKVLKKLLVVLLLVSTTGLFAQNQALKVGENGKTQNETVLTSQNDNATIIQFNLNEIDLIEVETGYGMAFIATTEKAPLILEAGSPEIFYLTASFIIPDRGRSELEISYGAFTDFENVEIAPSKGNLTRNIDPTTVPFVKGEVYSQNKFYPEILAGLREPFIMRDVRGQSVDVYPVQYNPVTKVLRVYSEITVTVNYTENEGINEFTNQKRHVTIDPTFAQMYNGLFINSSVIQQRGFPTGEEGEILIICHNNADWMNAMQPYIDWKHTIGRKTTMVSTTETGTTGAAIKAYIKDYYNKPENNLAYVLLVGDSQQIPVSYSYYSGGQTVYSDVDYGKMTTGNNYLDVLIGRMSCETVAHVQTQVQRSIWYERDITTADTWLSVGVGLAANEGAGGGHSGEADYVHINNIRNRLMTYGYDPVYQEYTWNSGVPNTSVAQISSRFNSGVSIANYCNHGDVNAWTLSTSYYGYLEYNNSHVNQLQNAGKLPYIFSVACLNGKFVSATCFAEAWLRATQSNQPTGAIATFMGTVELSWVPPMTAQDEFVNICLDLPPYSGQPAGIKRTIAGAMLNASQKMILVHGNSGMDDYNSWTVFGDPSLMFRTKTPQTMDISHEKNVTTSPITVTCNTDGALVALTYTNNTGEVIILGTAVVASGVAEIDFDDSDLTSSTELTIAVTGFNKVTYIDTILFDEGEEPEEPLAPQNLTFIVENVNHVVLSWDVPEEGKSLTVTGYNIYRNEELINEEPVNDDLAYTDTVTQNGKYEYVVTALYEEDGSIESDPSNTVTVIIDGMCIAIGSDIVVEQEEETYNVIISWEAPKYEGTELVGYNILRDTEQINAEVIPATELSFIDEDLEPETTYCYQVEVVYNDDCGELITNEECLIVQPIVSINEHAGTQTVQIFPNPTSGEFKVSGLTFKVESVEIFDVLGRKVQSFEFNVQSSETGNRNPETLNISGLPAGVYFIKINSEHGSITQKLIIK